MMGAVVFGHKKDVVGLSWIERGLQGVPARAGDRPGRQAANDVGVEGGRCFEVFAGESAVEIKDDRPDPERPSVAQIGTDSERLRV